MDGKANMAHDGEDDEASAAPVNREPQEKDTSTTTANEQTPKDMVARRKLLFMLSLNVLNFHRAIISSRRSCQQRIQRRRNVLRNYYMTQLLEMQTSYLQLLPALIRLHRNNNDCEVQPNTACTSQTLKGKTERVGDAQQRRFYEDIVSGFGPSEWLDTFRVSQTTFQWLGAQLNDALRPNTGANVPLKNLIPLEKRMALALYAFATGTDYREVAALFEVSRASVCKYIKRFAEAVIEVLGHHLLAMPNSQEEYDAIRKSFQAASNMPPLVVGVLGQCELPVNPMTERETSVYRKELGNATLIVQAMVDDKLLFRKVHMEGERPTLFLKDIITELPTQQINGREMSCFVVAPTTYYPLRKWLLRGYERSLVRTPHEHDFNDAIEQLLEFKDKAFRRLFGRWHLLHRKSDLEPKTMELIATACCALHNLLEENEDGYSEEWHCDVDMAKYTKCQFKREWRDNQIALEMRDFLARTISSTEM